MDSIAIKFISLIKFIMYIMYSSSPNTNVIVTYKLPHTLHTDNLNDW